MSKFDNPDDVYDPDDDFDEYDYDDDYEDGFDGVYVMTRNDKIRMFYHHICWFIRANFMLCRECHHRQKNCTCGLSSIPF